MKQVIENIKQTVRAGMRCIAQVLHAVSGGRITPNSITWFGFSMHIPIAVLIATGHFVWAGIFLIIFGLFDTLDGELARYQKRVTNNGGFLDASTDRLKEVLLYCGAGYILAQGDRPELAALAVLACGASLSVSYIKAKGEATVASATHKIPYPDLNKMFSGGLFPFEIRMLVLVVGLLSGQLVWAVGIIAVFSIITAFQRLFVISKRLQA